MNLSMLNIFLFIYFFANLHSLLAQEKESVKVYNYNDAVVIRTDSLVRGVYFNYEQFFYNKPEFTDLPMTLQKGVYLDKPYYLVKGEKLWLIDPVNKENTVMNPEGSTIWGWCDGNRIYQFNTTQFILFGKYCLVSGMNYATMSFVDGSKFMRSGPGDYAMDITTGLFYRLNMSFVESVLFNENPDLYKLFIIDKTRKYKLNWYIGELNKMYNQSYRQK